jgi:MFS family permease
VQVLAPLHLADTGLSDAGIGWVFTARAVASLATTLLLARLADRVNRVATMLVSIALAGAGYAVLATTPPRPVYIAATFALFVTAPLGVFAYALCAAGAEEAGIGSGVAIGAVNSMWAAGALVAPIAAGALAGVGGDALPFALMAAAAAALAAALLRTRATHVGRETTGRPVVSDGRTGKARAS